MLGPVGVVEEAAVCFRDLIVADFVNAGPCRF
jgi:hypothetical protein